MLRNKFKRSDSIPQNAAESYKNRLRFDGLFRFRSPHSPNQPPLSAEIFLDMNHASHQKGQHTQHHGDDEEVEVANQLL